jgi:hypothetical protein
MAEELIRPIDADSARAIEEAAKAAQKAIDAIMKAGGYVGGVLGDLPHDIVGIMGDWVKQVRARRWAELQAKTTRILGNRGVEKHAEISPSVAIPLITAAINEDRDVLKDLWAKLFAAAMDPARTNLVRPSLIELLKQMDPLDALALQQLQKLERVTSPGGSFANYVSQCLEVSQDEGFFSLQHLYELGCLNDRPVHVAGFPGLTAKARVLLRAVSD